MSKFKIAFALAAVIVILAAPAYAADVTTKPAGKALLATGTSISECGLGYFPEKERAA